LGGGGGGEITRVKLCSMAWPCIPHQPKMVSTIIKFALKHKIDIAVKGGGSINCPTFSIEGGIFIDLSKFKIVTVEAATKRVTVQGGALWSDVYAAIAPHNLAMAGPVINTVGVGGSSLMGGYGWLTGKHGMTLDNIVSVEMVLASGEIVHVSEHENEDLFRAVRGAGACFGVVTTFVFQAYTQDHMVWHGNLILPRSALGAPIEVANKVLEKGNGVAAMGMLWGKPSGQAHPGLVIISYYDGKEEEAKEFFKPLLDQKPFVNATKMMHWNETIRLEPIVNSEKPLRRSGLVFLLLVLSISPFSSHYGTIMRASQPKWKMLRRLLRTSQYIILMSP
jgi:hypothetical protein